MQQTELLKAATQVWAGRTERAHGGLSAEKSFHLGDRREEERSDVVEVCAVMFRSGGRERQMMRKAKSSQHFSCRGEKGR